MNLKHIEDKYFVSEMDLIFYQQVITQRRRSRKQFISFIPSFVYFAKVTMKVKPKTKKEY